MLTFFIQSKGYSSIFIQSPPFLLRELEGPSVVQSATFELRDAFVMAAMRVWGGASDAAEEYEQQWEQPENCKDALEVLVDARPAMFQPCPRGGQAGEASGRRPPPDSRP